MKNDKWLPWLTKKLNGTKNVFLVEASTDVQLNEWLGKKVYLHGHTVQYIDHGILKMTNQIKSLVLTKI